MPSRRAADDGLVRAIWDQPEDWLQMAGAPSQRSAARLDRSIARTASACERNGRGHGAGDCGVASPVSTLWSAQAAGEVAAAGSIDRLAGGEHDRRSMDPAAATSPAACA